MERMNTFKIQVVASLLYGQYGLSVNNYVHTCMASNSYLLSKIHLESKRILLIIVWLVGVHPDLNSASNVPIGNHTKILVQFHLT